jgi:hypothetical protein
LVIYKKNMTKKKLYAKVFRLLDKYGALQNRNMDYFKTDVITEMVEDFVKLAEWYSKKI